ncbi:hypothetical protein YC2023_055394 [Brassica napus]
MMKSGSSDVAFSSTSRFCYKTPTRVKGLYHSMDNKYNESGGDWFARGSGGNDWRRTQRPFRTHERRGRFEERTKNNAKTEGGEEEKIRKKRWW